ncbi:CHAP domain-containing protein [Ktedonospora formicarum]|uniref:Peptidase C51 domain-containing protein n=1 Tax=Ktedonospora formicarum TaxID=2778364 RepID=A0A8J3IBM7_9CHLR|nr:CHAP domain-containing protein [Ktedonospora formicarum]GHO51001.1 hypothetical protein KSX_91640 [Ktedonospora formicarum]
MTEQDKHSQAQGGEDDVVQHFQGLSNENAQLVDNLREAYSLTRVRRARALAQARQRIQYELQASDTRRIVEVDSINALASTSKKIKALIPDIKKPNRLGWLFNTCVAAALLIVMVGSMILVYGYRQTSTSVGSKSNNPTVTVAAPTQWPKGEDTYWANYRFHQLTGRWIPWRGSPNQWVTGAQTHGWQVSAEPHIPAILVLMPGVQGAGGVGHVAVVEKIDSNGQSPSVYTSNYGWYTNGGGKGILSYANFTAGNGAYFIWLD